MTTHPIKIALKRRSIFVCQSSWIHNTLRQYATAYPRPDPAVAAALYGGLDNDDLIYDFAKNEKRPKRPVQRNETAIILSSDKVDREKKAEKVKGTDRRSKKKSIESEKNNDPISSEKSSREPTDHIVQVKRGKSARSLSPSISVNGQDDEKKAKSRFLPIRGSEMIELFREASAKKAKHTNVKLTDWLNVAQKLDEERVRQALKPEDFIGAMQSLNKSKKLESLLACESKENSKGHTIKGVDELVNSIVEMIQLARQEGKSRRSERGLKKLEDLKRANEPTTEAYKEVTKAKKSRKRKKLGSPKGDEQDLMTTKAEGEGILEAKELQNDAQASKDVENLATKSSVNSSTDVEDKMSSKGTGEDAGKNLLRDAVRDGVRSSIRQKGLNNDKKGLIRKLFVDLPEEVEDTVSSQETGKDADEKGLIRKLFVDFPEEVEDTVSSQETVKDADEKGLIRKLFVDFPEEVEDTVSSQETSKDADEKFPKADLVINSRPSTHSKMKPDDPDANNTKIWTQRLSKEINNLKSRIRRRYAVIYKKTDLAQIPKGEGKPPIRNGKLSRPINKLSIIKYPSTSTRDQNVATSSAFSRLPGNKSLKGALTPSTIEENSIQDESIGVRAPVEQVSARQLEIAALAVNQPPVPTLSYGLDRVLFNPGVYHLQDPRSQVYNFDPYLQRIMPISEFDFNALKEYITSSKDRSLEELAKNNGKRYVGSSSSMTGALAHFHFLFSQWREINTSMMSRQFPDNLKSFTLLQRAPSAIILNWRNGTYAIDADKEFASSSVLSMLGKSMEKLLTLNTEEFERYRKGNSDQISSEERNAPESYHYCCMGDVLMRSQLDAFDARLPGTGMFDLKTRAVVSVRMDTRNYQEGSSYEIKGRYGAYESYEREYYDMIRAAFLKYSLQVRMGRMDGIFVAFHNTDRIFGFQYISLAEMDLALHGQEDTRLGDEEFKLSIDLLNKILDKATKKYPEQSLRIHFETREAATPFMYIAAEPVTEDQVRNLQTRNDAKIEDFEHSILGLNKSSDPSDDKAWDSIRAEIQKAMDRDEKSIDEKDAEVVSYTGGELNNSPTDGLKNHDSFTVVDAGNDNISSPSLLPGGNKKLMDEDSEETANETREKEEEECEEEEADDKNSEMAGELENTEDELEDENDRVTIQEKDEVNEEGDEIVGGEKETEAAECGEIEEAPEQEDPENKVAGLITNTDNDPAGLDQKTTRVESAQNLEDNGDGEGTHENGVSRTDGSSNLGLSEENENVWKESATLSDTDSPDDSEASSADVPFVEPINQERAAERPLSEVLLMTLTIRNKVNNIHYTRPTSLQAGDDWTVQYSLTEEPKPERAWSLYQAIQTRRKKQLDLEEDNSKPTVDYYIKKLRSLSAQGKKWRKEQDEKYDGSPKVVWGQSSASRRPSDASPEASPNT